MGVAVGFDGSRLADAQSRDAIYRVRFVLKVQFYHPQNQVQSGNENFMATTEHTINDAAEW